MLSHLQDMPSSNRKHEEAKEQAHQGKGDDHFRSFFASDRVVTFEVPDPFMIEQSINMSAIVGGLELPSEHAKRSSRWSLTRLAKRGMFWVKQKLASSSAQQSMSQQERKIFNSFVMRLAQTSSLLVELQLETRASIRDKIKRWNKGNEDDTGFPELVALTILNAAFASRGIANVESILLANGSVLTSDICSDEGRIVFDKICITKQILRGMQMHTLDTQCASHMMI